MEKKRDELKYHNVNIVFSYKECQQEYQNILMNFENNKYSTVIGLSINSFSYSEISKRFFLIFLQDLSNFSNFKNFETVFHFIKKKFSNLSKEGVDLLEKMLALDPNKRISAREALEHPFFQVEPLPCSNKEIATLIEKIKKMEITSNNKE